MKRITRKTSKAAQSADSFDYEAEIPDVRTRLRLRKIKVFPHVVVFDVDDTLIDGDCEYTCGPPFKPGQILTNGGIKSIRDKTDFELGLFPDTLSILSWLHFQRNFDLRDPDHCQAFWRGELPSSSHAENVCPILGSIAAANTEIGYASRTIVPSVMTAVLKVLAIPGKDGCQGLTLFDVAQYRELYPGDKHRHLSQIAGNAGCKGKDLLFFDNEGRNISTAQKIGVPCHYVPRGISWASFVVGLEKYQETVLSTLSTNDRSEILTASTTFGSED